MATTAPATANPTANRAELLAIADSVAREKLIDRAIVIEAMEDAIQRAARARCCISGHGQINLPEVRSRPTRPLDQLDRPRCYRRRRC